MRFIPSSYAKRPMRPWIAAALVCLALTACGGRLLPSVPTGAAWDALPNACYVTTIAPKTVKARITFYGWPDNTPPGNAIAHPVIHHVAGGDGTYCNPTTFATENANNKRIPYGTKIYVSYMKQYFIREDQCAPSGPSSGSGSNGCTKLWFDLWIGGNAHSNFDDVIDCEIALTKSSDVSVVLDPGPGLPVANSGPIYRNSPTPKGTCDGKPSPV
ncbi:MAG: hypothetical protein JO192_07020 [Candidatus Eremiobacteraeota bacterium]|nr:hypothetical protein [Candidatus Eremiobacteraeota bacterium]